MIATFLLCELAELEDRFWDSRKPREPGFFRRGYLRRMGVRFGENLCTRPGLRILRPNALKLGDRVALGHDTRIYNHDAVEIGDGFLGAGGLVLNAGTHDVDTLEPKGAPIRIGKRVWCGERVTILAGVTVGDDAVLAAGALVQEDVPPGAVVAGVPARVIRYVKREPGARLWSPYPGGPNAGA